MNTDTAVIKPDKPIDPPLRVVSALGCEADKSGFSNETWKKCDICHFFLLM